MAYLASESGLLGQHQFDENLSDSQKQDRALAFAALAPLSLNMVPAADVTSAIEDMHLSASAKQALLSDLAQPQAAVSVPDSPQHETTPVANQSQSAPESALPAPKIAVRKRKSIRLAWITLWDTDAEDGDAVRIDSQGYSRTVTLTKQPVTFAIPIPANGIIKVTGIQDGEGGGITVGLASGESKAVFPIMSIGQTLGLKVRVN